MEDIRIAISFFRVYKHPGYDNLIYAGNATGSGVASGVRVVNFSNWRVQVHDPS